MELGLVERVLVIVVCCRRLNQAWYAMFVVSDRIKPFEHVSCDCSYDFG